RGKVCGEFLSAINLPLLGHLGVAESFLELAGPEVRQVGLFSGDHAVTSDMPRPGTSDGTGYGWGRALGRDRLDTLLLHRAAAAGAHIWQPWSAVELVNHGGGYLCRAVSRESGRSRELRARIVAAAHGSWEPGPLPTQPARPAARPSDLFGFKAHFLDSRLPAGPCSRISNNLVAPRARLWRAPGWRMTGCRPGRFGLASGGVDLTVFFWWATLPAKPTPPLPRGSAWRCNRRGCCASVSPRDRPTSCRTRWWMR